MTIASQKGFSTKNRKKSAAQFNQSPSHLMARCIISRVFQGVPCNLRSRAEGALLNSAHLSEIRKHARRAGAGHLEVSAERLCDSSALNRPDCASQALTGKAAPGAINCGTQVPDSDCEGTTALQPSGGVRPFRPRCTFSLDARKAAYEFLSSRNDRRGCRIQSAHGQQVGYSLVQPRSGLISSVGKVRCPRSFQYFS
jgi:hypothetical protein